MICSTLKPVLKGECSGWTLCVSQRSYASNIAACANNSKKEVACICCKDLGTDLSQRGSIGAECRPTDTESQDVVVRNRYVLHLLLF